MATSGSAESWGLRGPLTRRLSAQDLLELGAEVGSVRGQANRRFVFLHGFLLLTEPQIDIPQQVAQLRIIRAAEFGLFRIHTGPRVVITFPPISRGLIVPNNGVRIEFLHFCQMLV